MMSSSQNARPAPPGADTALRSALFGSSENQLLASLRSVEATQTAPGSKAGVLHRAVAELPAAAMTETPLLLA